MITQYHFTVVPADGQKLSSAMGYPLYAWLLAQLPEEVGAALHQQEALTPAQCLYFDRGRGRWCWQLTLPSEELITMLRPVLEDLQAISLHTGALQITRTDTLQYESGKALLDAARSLTPMGRRTEIRFLTTTTFKQDGNYVLFPQVRLILQSLVGKWNQLCPEYSLEDADAFHMLERGLAITDYQLRASRFPLKGKKITGFSGSITVTSRLSPPLEELWQLLLLIAPLTGVGIKTALGMGGIAVFAFNDK